MDRTYVVDSLRFWETLPSGRKDGSEARELEAEIRGAVGRMDDATLGHFTEITRRQVGDQTATHGSVTSRGGSLLLFVGVVSAGATIVASSLASASIIVLSFTVVVGACLLYACLAVAFLAVRAQEVAMWQVAAIDPRNVSDARGLCVDEASQLAFAYQQNKGVLRNQVAYLADAQRWARRAIVLVVVLAVLSVGAAATKPPPAPTAPSGPVRSTPGHFVPNGHPRFR